MLSREAMKILRKKCQRCGHQAMNHTPEMTAWTNRSTCIRWNGGPISGHFCVCEVGRREMIPAVVDEVASGRRRGFRELAAGDE